METTEKAETKKLLRELGEQARLVADADREKREAIAAERASRAELLGAVIDAVRPALSTLGTVIPLDSVGGDRWPERGLHVGWKKGLAGKFYPPGPVVSAGSADPRRGRYAGRDLFLLEDGALLEVLYDGPWTTVSGELCSWEVSTRLASPEIVVVDYDVADIMSAIGVALLAQAGGNNRKVARRAGELAQRLHAIAVLVRAA